MSRRLRTTRGRRARFRGRVELLGGSWGLVAYVDGFVGGTIEKASHLWAGDRWGSLGTGECEAQISSRSWITPSKRPSSSSSSPRPSSRAASRARRGMRWRGPSRQVRVAGCNAEFHLAA